MTTILRDHDAKINKMRVEKGERRNILFICAKLTTNNKLRATSDK
jgi:hypothetical protein